MAKLEMGCPFRPGWLVFFWSWYTLVLTGTPKRRAVHRHFGTTHAKHHGQLIGSLSASLDPLLLEFRGQAVPWQSDELCGSEISG